MFAVFNVVRKEGANFPIFKEDLENWGISIDTLWEDAIESSPKWKHPQIWDIYEFMGVPSPKGGSKVHFISDVQRDNYGAACIFAKGYLQEVAEILGSDLYIIPSSISECIVLPENAVPVNRLTDMLHEVNGMTECVPPDEKLSDFIYHYDREKHTLEQCEATTNVVLTL